MQTRTPESTETLALAKLVAEKAEKEARAAVKPGVHLIDMTVRVRGTIKVGADFQGKVATRIPWQRLAAVLFSKLNDVTMESVVAEALAMTDEQETAVKASAEHAIEKLVASTESTQKGRVTASLVSEIVVE
jgi:hypothetical protein